MLQHILIAALFAFGWCSCFWEKMIFERIGDWAKSKFPEYITNPIFACPICNAFWVSTLMYWLIWDGRNVVEWLTGAFCSIGFNAILVNITNKIGDISEAIDDANDSASG